MYSARGSIIVGGSEEWLCGRIMELSCEVCNVAGLKLFEMLAFEFMTSGFF